MVSIASATSGQIAAALVTLGLTASTASSVSSLTYPLAAISGLAGKTPPAFASPAAGTTTGSYSPNIASILSLDGILTVPSGPLA